MDYSSIQNMELIFPPGSVTNSTVCFNIDIINNTLIQADRTFSVTLQRTDPAVVLSSAMTMAIITIRQNSIDSKSTELVIVCHIITNLMCPYHVKHLMQYHDIT